MARRINLNGDDEWIEISAALDKRVQDYMFENNVDPATAFEEVVGLNPDLLEE